MRRIVFQMLFNLAHARVPNVPELRAPLSAKAGEKLGGVLLYEGGERGRKRGEREEGQSAN